LAPSRFGRIKSERNWRELEEMAAAVARYDGPITRCPTGVARGHQSRPPVAVEPERGADEPGAD